MMNGECSSKPHELPFQKLKEMTNNFSDMLVVGAGQFGVVYKGVQPNGEIVAVKKLLNAMSQKQFENEVDLLVRLEHQNIVRLIGYCYEIQNKHVPHNGKYVFAGEVESLLVLEYLPNGSLDIFLSDLDKSSRLDWHTRYKIIEGVCNGLEYLHEQSNGPIIHLDLKPSNILLNEALEPKIADFGLSRLLDQHGTVCTMEVSGTLGYMPPEYLQGIVGTMSDIFSLGVIILEVVTGERKYPEDIPRLEEFIETELEKWRDTLQKAPEYTSLGIDCLQIRRCIQTGIKCMNSSRAKRPTITKIMKMLQGLEESTDCNVSNEIRSGPRELLDIYPLELSFVLEPHKLIRCLVKLINKTNEYVAFHFKVTRKTSKYCIEPDGGFLWPRSMTNVVVTMEERGELLPSDLQCNDEFLVQSFTVKEDRVTPKHIPEHIFDRTSSKGVHRVKLPVIHVPSLHGTPDPPHFEGSQGLKISANKRLQQLNQEQVSTRLVNSIEGGKDNLDALVECLRKDLGYCEGKPVAAVVIYRCSVRWRSFEAKKTSIFDCLIKLIECALEDQDNNETVAYWLSNSSALLLLMQRTCISSRGTMLMGTRATPQISMFRENFNTQNIIEARYPVASYPALLFKLHLIAKLEKMYAMIRDNLKREVSAFLDLCIQAPKTFRASLISGASVANVLAQQALIGHWQSIVKILTNYLGVLKSNYVPSFLICKLFVQIFSYINVQLFNSLLLRRQCCSFINGEYVRAGLTELEKWIIDATEEYAGCSWDELKHIRQAVEFLVTFQGPMKTLIEITNDLCPVLSLQQRCRISSMLSDAKCGTLLVSSEVLSSMKTMITENSKNGASDFVILDDNICIPFSVDDILNCAPGFDIRNVDMPPLVLEHPCFSFLHETKDKLDAPAIHVKMPPVLFQM